MEIRNDELIGLSGGRKTMYLRQHRQDVLDYYVANGRKATMEHYRITKDYTLDAVLIRAENTTAKPRSEFAGIKGGVKEMLLRQRKDEVVEFYEKHGEAATRYEYTLKRETLEAVLTGGRRKPFVAPFSKVDRLELLVEQYRYDAQNLGEKYDVLLEAFLSFQAQVADRISEKFLLPLIQHGIEIDDNLVVKPRPDKLSLEGFNLDNLERHSRKRAKNL